MPKTLTRVRNRVVKALFPLVFRPDARRDDLVRLGTDYGGWWVPRDLLGPESVCFCAGVGTDVSFDVALIETFGCTVLGIDPTPLRKRIADILDQLVREDADTEKLIGGAGRQQSRGKAPVPGLSSRARASAEAHGGGEARGDLIALISELTDQMHAAAAELQFELAARIRDEIRDLKHELRGMQAAGV